jgi:hypothetical protein
MKLDEFVRQTLLDITNGVAQAQLETKLYIAPGHVENRKLIEPQFVKFEVIVSVNKEAGGGISVWSFGDVRSGYSSEHSNRISFDVPVYFQAPTERSDLHYSKRQSKSEQ